MLPMLRAHAKKCSKTFVIIYVVCFNLDHVSLNYSPSSTTLTHPVNLETWLMSASRGKIHVIPSKLRNESELDA